MTSNFDKQKYESRDMNTLVEMSNNWGDDFIELVKKVLMKTNRPLFEKHNGLKSNVSDTHKIEVTAQDLVNEYPFFIDENIQRLACWDNKRMVDFIVTLWKNKTNKVDFMVVNTETSSKKCIGKSDRQYHQEILDLGYKYNCYDGGNRYRLLKSILKPNPGEESLVHPVVKKACEFLNVHPRILYDGLRSSLVWICISHSMTRNEIHENFVKFNSKVEVTEEEKRTGIDTSVSHFLNDMKNKYRKFLNDNFTNGKSRQHDKVITWNFLIEYKRVNGKLSDFKETDVTKLVSEKKDYIELRENFSKKFDVVMGLYSKYPKKKTKLNKPKKDGTSIIYNLMDYVSILVDNGKRIKPNYYPEFMTRFVNYIETVDRIGEYPDSLKEMNRTNYKFVSEKNKLFRELFYEIPSTACGFSFKEFIEDDKQSDYYKRLLLSKNDNKVRVNATDSYGVRFDSSGDDYVQNENPEVNLLVVDENTDDIMTKELYDWIKVDNRKIRKNVLYCILVKGSKKKLIGYSSKLDNLIQSDCKKLSISFDSYDEEIQPSVFVNTFEQWVSFKDQF